MATHSGRSYNSHQLARLHQGLVPPGQRRGRGKSRRSAAALRVGYSSRLRSPTAAYQAAVDKFEPPSEVSNFDQTATMFGARLPSVRLDLRGAPPPDTPAARSKEPSSPLKNVESSAFSVFLSSNSWGDRLVVSCCRLGRQQFGNADQVVGDQIEHEIGSDLGYAAMFCFAHRAVLFAPTEDAFDHRPARLR